MTLMYALSPSYIGPTVCRPVYSIPLPFFSPEQSLASIYFLPLWTRPIPPRLSLSSISLLFPQFVLGLFSRCNRGNRKRRKKGKRETEFSNFLPPLLLLLLPPFRKEEGKTFLSFFFLFPFCFCLPETKISSFSISFLPLFPPFLSEGEDRG